MSNDESTDYAEEMNLDELRDEIRSIDREIVELIAQVHLLGVVGGFVVAHVICVPSVCVVVSSVSPSRS